MNRRLSNHPFPTGFLIDVDGTYSLSSHYGFALDMCATEVKPILDIVDLKLFESIVMRDFLFYLRETSIQDLLVLCIHVKEYSAPLIDLSQHLL